jgi:hypothetical protein
MATKSERLFWEQDRAFLSWYHSKGSRCTEAVQEQMCAYAAGRVLQIKGFARLDSLPPPEIPAQPPMGQGPGLPRRRDGRVSSMPGASLRSINGRDPPIRGPSNSLLEVCKVPLDNSSYTTRTPSLARGVLVGSTWVDLVFVSSL